MIDPRIVKLRGRTADAQSVTVVTTDPATGDPARIASYAGSDYGRAQRRMAEYAINSGRNAWLVRGTAAAMLPFPQAD